MTRPSLYTVGHSEAGVRCIEDDRENDKEKGEESLTGTRGGWRPPAVGRIGWMRVGGSEMSSGIERKGRWGGRGWENGQGRKEEVEGTGKEGREERERVRGERR